MKPLIIVDATDIDRPSGVRTAVLELFQSVFLHPESTQWQFIVLVSQYEPAFNHGHVKQIIIPRLARPVERLIVQLYVTYFALIKHAAIVHFARTIGGVGWPAHTIITVFDATTLKLPHLHSRSAIFFWKHIQPRLFRAAKRIIVISKDVKNDLIHLMHIPEDQIAVIYCAPKKLFNTPPTLEEIQEIREKYDLPPRYLLYIGLIAKKKNLGTLIRALSILSNQGYTPPLILAGRLYKQSDGSAIFQLIETLKLTDKVSYIGAVPDQDLKGLYGGAEIFIYPSLHEGFGIPCIEAMKCGVPVIASHSGAIPEITQDAALLVTHPTDAKALSEAIQQLMQNKQYHGELIRRGLKRSRSFSWEKSAQQLIRLYQQVLGEGAL